MNSSGFKRCAFRSTELTVEKLKQFVPQLLDRLFLETLIYGNVTREDARRLANIAADTLRSGVATKPLLPSQKRQYREIQLPDGETTTYVGVQRIQSPGPLFSCPNIATHSCHGRADKTEQQTKLHF